MISFSARATETSCLVGPATIILMADLLKISVRAARARTHSWAVIGFL